MTVYFQHICHHCICTLCALVKGCELERNGMLTQKDSSKEFSFTYSFWHEEPNLQAALTNSWSHRLLVVAEEILLLPFVPLLQMQGSRRWAGRGKGNNCTLLVSMLPYSQWDLQHSAQINQNRCANLPGLHIYVVTKTCTVSLLKNKPVA